MVEMSIRTRDPKKSTRGPGRGDSARVRNAGTRRVLHSLPVPSFPAEIAEDGRRPVRVGLRGVVRATAPGARDRPDGHIVVVPDVADAGSHLCRLFRSKRRRIGSVRSSFAFQGSRGERSRVQTRVKRPGARASSVVRATAPGARDRPDGHIVVVPDVADAGSHLCRLFRSKRRRIGSVRSSFAFQGSRGERSRVQTRVKRPGARASSAVRA